MTQLSTIVTTHRICYKDGDTYKDVRMTEEEASDALAAWNNWKPVPVPNTHKEAKRSPMYFNPKMVILIKRYQYINKPK